MNYFGFGLVIQVEISFKRFLIWSSGGPPVRWSGTIYVLLKDVKLFEIGTSGSGGDFI